MEPGTAVRLAEPLNPHHPRAGRTGVVVDATRHAAVSRKSGDGERVVRPARVLCWVRFPIEHDCWDLATRFGVVAPVWGVYATEMVAA